MRTLILCGGKGTRAYPHTLEVPKPLLEVDARPVVLHLMQIYAAQGFTDFVLAAGYRCDLIEQFAGSLREGWSVEVVDTGEDTNTGGRVLACLDRLGPTAFVTYADGLGDVDLHRLATFHDNHTGAATLTTVPLRSQYGTVVARPDGRVQGFREKPRLHEHRINAGFFVLDARVADQWAGDDLERDVLPDLAGRGELFAYHHDGFWRSLDTYKDALELSVLCADGAPPWQRTWP